MAVALSADPSRRRRIQELDLEIAAKKLEKQFVLASVRLKNAPRRSVVPKPETLGIRPDQLTLVRKVRNLGAAWLIHKEYEDALDAFRMQAQRVVQRACFRVSNDPTSERGEGRFYLRDIRIDEVSERVGDIRQEWERWKAQHDLAALHDEHVRRQYSEAARVAELYGDLAAERYLRHLLGDGDRPALLASVADMQQASFEVHFNSVSFLPHLGQVNHARVLADQESDVEETCRYLLDELGRALERGCDLALAAADYSKLTDGVRTKIAGMAQRARELNVLGYEIGSEGAGLLERVAGPIEMQPDRLEVMELKSDIEEWMASLQQGVPTKAITNPDVVSIDVDV